MKLLDLASFITLLVVGLQFMINIFLADYLERYWINHGNDINLSRIKRNHFADKWNWAILMLYIVAITIGGIGILRE